MLLKVHFIHLCSTWFFDVHFNKSRDDE
jgi:hypothetical protein